jgi:DNA polymerase III alpha subunit
MESMIGNPDDRSQAISDVKKMGYSIGNVDINLSTNQWSIDSERKILIPSFNTIKGVGETAIEEITSRRPYKSIEEMLWNDDGHWRPSKFNRRALEALIQANAFESMNVVGANKQFSSWKQMHHVLIENSDDIKKWAKKDPHRGINRFRELVIETDGMPEWTRREIATMQVELSGKLDPSALISPELRQKFNDKEVYSIDNWERLDVYWFVIIGSVEKKTKNGKQYLLLQVIGEAGNMEKMFMWDWDGKITFEPYTLCVAEIDRSDFGLSTKGKKIKVMQ